jgi:hypothetical protein
MFLLYGGQGLAMKAHEDVLEAWRKLITKVVSR